MSGSPASHVSHEPSTFAVGRSSGTPAASRRATPARQSIQKHTKTRTGCKICKKRKVKCDEGRPSCRNCIKHLVQCDFATPVTRSNNIFPAEAIAPLNLLDLELMNNFTSSTYNTFSNNATARSVWKTAVVRKALGCDFLMRALLAVSAIHMAQHRPEKEHLYLSHAFAYHDMASRIAVSLMDSMLPENVEDLWIFSVLTLYFALGTPRDPRSASASENGDNLLPEWVFLFNGVHQMFFALQSTSYTGIVTPLLNHGAEVWKLAHQSEHEDANILHELSARISATVDNEGDAAIYQRAIRELRCQVSMALSPQSRDMDITDVFVWHFVVAEDFMPLLKQGRQEAVVIFVHSLIVLSAVNWSKWLNGWDTSLMSRAWNILDAEHRLWIQWPIEEIGWIPPK